MNENNMIIHRDDCVENIRDNVDCVGCFAAEVLEAMRAAHDHMLMERTNVTHTRSYKLVKHFLDKYDK